jgi:3-oxoacyl-(acyl-carrier-protein) synthase
MMDVWNLIKNYKFDRVVVLTVEDAVSNSVLEFFGEAKASLSHQEEQDGILPSAFDDHNYGFRVAQGSALAVFESEAYVEKSGKMPIAELLGAYTASEACTNAIGQREDGQGFVNSIKGTLEVAGISADDIEVIKTHGTGTKSNNQAETTARESLFTDFKATSLKPTIGHTMGVSGLLETCLLMDMVCDGYVPAIANRTSTDSRYLSHPHEFNGGLILSIASGMGNVYSSAVFRRAF